MASTKNNTVEGLFGPGAALDFDATGYDDKGLPVPRLAGATPEMEHQFFARAVGNQSVIKMFPTPLGRSQFAATRWKESLARRGQPIRNDRGQSGVATVQGGGAVAARELTLPKDDEAYTRRASSEVRKAAKPPFGHGHPQGEGHTHAQIDTTPFDGSSHATYVTPEGKEAPRKQSRHHEDEELDSLDEILEGEVPERLGSLTKIQKAFGLAGERQPPPPVSRPFSAPEGKPTTPSIAPPRAGSGLGQRPAQHQMYSKMGNKGQNLIEREFGITEPQDPYISGHPTSPLYGEEHGITTHAKEYDPHSGTFTDVPVGHKNANPVSTEATGYPKRAVETTPSRNAKHEATSNTVGLQQMYPEDEAYLELEQLDNEIEKSGLGYPARHAMGKTNAKKLADAKFRAEWAKKLGQMTEMQPPKPARKPAVKPAASAASTPTAVRQPTEVDWADVTAAGPKPKSSVGRRIGQAFDRGTEAISSALGQDQTGKHHMGEDFAKHLGFSKEEHERNGKLEYDDMDYDYLPPHPSRPQPKTGARHAEAFATDPDIEKDRQRHITASEMGGGKPVKYARTKEEIDAEFEEIMGLPRHQMTSTGKAKRAKTEVRSALPERIAFGNLGVGPRLASRELRGPARPTLTASSEQMAGELSAKPGKTPRTYYSGGKPVRKPTRRSQADRNRLANIRKLQSEHEGHAAARQRAEEVPVPSEEAKAKQQLMNVFTDARRGPRVGRSPGSAKRDYEGGGTIRQAKPTRVRTDTNHMGRTVDEQNVTGNALKSAFGPQHRSSSSIPVSNYAASEDKVPELARVTQIRQGPTHGPRRRAKLPSATANVSPQKARTILRDGTVHGHTLTEKQRGLFGAIAGKGR